MEPIRLGISVLDRHSWRPRHGAKLTLDRAPGWMELYATRHVGNIPRVFLYGPVALVLPLLLSFSGRGELPLKSIGFTALALWLAVDLWHLVLKKKWRWRFIAGWTGTSLLLIGAIGMMYLLLAGKLADEREEVRSHI